MTLGSFGSKSVAVLCTAFGSTSSQVHNNGCDEECNQLFHVGICLVYFATKLLCKFMVKQLSVTQYPVFFATKLLCKFMVYMGGGWDFEADYEMALPALPPLK